MDLRITRDHQKVIPYDCVVFRVAVFDLTPRLHGCGMDRHRACSIAERLGMAATPGDAQRTSR